ncbi:MAG TPA: hypothetical protein PKD00_01720 [Burkholderiales bacterium]|nr:hypothetical protein [Burkholderiales bacterium]
MQVTNEFIQLRSVLKSILHQIKCNTDIYQDCGCEGSTPDNDIELIVEGTSCLDDVVSVRYRLRNVGSSTIPEDTQLSILTAQPITGFITSSAITQVPVDGLFQLTADLEPGDYLIFTISFENVGCVEMDIDTYAYLIGLLETNLDNNHATASL